MTELCTCADYSHTGAILKDTKVVVYKVKEGRREREREREREEKEEAGHLLENGVNRRTAGVCPGVDVFAKLVGTQKSTHFPSFPTFPPF